MQLVSLSMPRRATLMVAGTGAALVAAALLGITVGTVRADTTGDPYGDGQTAPFAPMDAISVVGVGGVFVSPDVADIQLGVIVRGDAASDASTEAALAMDAVIDALLEAGIAETDIRTSQLSLYPVYDYEASSPTIEGWEATNMVSVTIRDVTTVGRIIDGSVAAGATSVQGISFRVDDPSEYEALARSAAVADAKAKATQLAEEAGVGIGGIVIISEGSFNPPTPIIVEQSFDGYGDTAAGATTAVLPGNVEVSVNVFIAYGIE